MEEAQTEYIGGCLAKIMCVEMMDRRLSRKRGRHVLNRYRRKEQPGQQAAG